MQTVFLWVAKSIMILLRVLLQVMVVGGLLCACVSPVDLTSKEPIQQEMIPEDMWTQFRGQLALQDINHQKIEKKRIILGRNPAILKQLDPERARILDYVIDEAEKRGLPAEVALLPLIESGYRPDARSPSAYAGLWQLGAPTARNFGLSVDKKRDARLSIRQSTDAALTYLEYLNKMFDGDWLLTLAAYNAGEGRVKRALSTNLKNDQEIDYWHLQLPKHTQDYVVNVLALSAIINESDHFNVRTAPEDGLVPVRIAGDKSLTWAAEQSGIPLKNLEFYNPHLRTAPSSPTDKTVMMPAISAQKIITKTTASLASTRNKQTVSQAGTVVTMLAPANKPSDSPMLKQTPQQNSGNRSQK